MSVKHYWPAVSFSIVPLDELVSKSFYVSLTGFVVLSAKLARGLVNILRATWVWFASSVKGFSIARHIWYAVMPKWGFSFFQFWGQRKLDGLAQGPSTIQIGVDAWLPRLEIMLIFQIRSLLLAHSFGFLTRTSDTNTSWSPLSWVEYRTNINTYIVVLYKTLHRLWFLNYIYKNLTIQFFSCS